MEKWEYLAIFGFLLLDTRNLKVFHFQMTVFCQSVRSAFLGFFANVTSHFLQKYYVTVVSCS